MDEKFFTFDYKGTKIRIAFDTAILTFMLLVVDVMLIWSREWDAAGAASAILLLPYIHEAGHAIMAKERGYGVPEITFSGSTGNTKVSGNLTHWHTYEIALTGEVMNALVFIGSAGAVSSWGAAHSLWLMQVPVPIIIVGVWIMGWFIPGSDMEIAFRAYRNHWNQRKAERMGVPPT